MDDSLDLNLLRTFTPLDGLRLENLTALARKTGLRRLPASQALFRSGDKDKQTVYLVEGEVELCLDDKVVARIKAGSIDARNALAPMMPRRFTARAATAVVYLSIDSDLLDVLLTWDQTGTYEIAEITPLGTTSTTSTSLRSPVVPSSADGVSDSDWMTTLLQVKAFHQLPAVNLQQIFSRVQKVNFKAGDTVIKQGTPGDYFYAITSGTCAIVRDTSLHANGLKLAELGPGESFGEEALISGTVRNANVVMVTDGLLIRLTKEDFLSLMTEPMIRWVESDALEVFERDPAVTIVDVRLPSEYERGHLPRSINVPLYFLRLKAPSLDPTRQYLLACDTGRRSSAGAFLLTELGLQAYALRGGLPASVHVGATMDPGDSSSASA
jgi:CRP-like cAMP-binding protein